MLKRRLAWLMALTMTFTGVDGSVLIAVAGEEPVQMEEMLLTDDEVAAEQALMVDAPSAGVWETGGNTPDDTDTPEENGFAEDLFAEPGTIDDETPELPDIQEAIPVEDYLLFADELLIDDEEEVPEDWYQTGDDEAVEEENIDELLFVEDEEEEYSARQNAELTVQSVVFTPDIETYFAAIDSGYTLGWKATVTYSDGVVEELRVRDNYLYVQREGFECLPLNIVDVNASDSVYYNCYERLPAGSYELRAKAIDQDGNEVTVGKAAFEVKAPSDCVFQMLQPGENRVTGPYNSFRDEINWYCFVPDTTGKYSIYTLMDDVNGFDHSLCKWVKTEDSEVEAVPGGYYHLEADRKYYIGVMGLCIDDCGITELDGTLNIRYAPELTGVSIIPGKTGYVERLENGYGEDWTVEATFSNGQTVQRKIWGSGVYLDDYDLRIRYRDDHDRIYDGGEYFWNNLPAGSYVMEVYDPYDSDRIWATQNFSVTPLAEIGTLNVGTNQVSFGSADTGFSKWYRFDVPEDGYYSVRFVGESYVDHDWSCSCLKQDEDGEYFGSEYFDDRLQKDTVCYLRLTKDGETASDTADFVITMEAEITGAQIIPTQKEYLADVQQEFGYGWKVKVFFSDGTQEEVTLTASSGYWLENDTSISLEISDPSAGSEAGCGFVDLGDYNSLTPGTYTIRVKARDEVMASETFEVKSLDEMDLPVLQTGTNRITSSMSGTWYRFVPEENGYYTFSPKGYYGGDLGSALSVYRSEGTGMVSLNGTDSGVWLEKDLEYYVRILGYLYDVWDEERIYSWNMTVSKGEETEKAELAGAELIRPDGGNRYLAGFDNGYNVLGNYGLQVTWKDGTVKKGYAGFVISGAGDVCAELYQDAACTLPVDVNWAFEHAGTYTVQVYLAGSDDTYTDTITVQSLEEALDGTWNLSENLTLARRAQRYIYRLEVPQTGSVNPEWVIRSDSSITFRKSMVICNAQLEEITKEPGRGDLMLKAEAGEEYYLFVDCSRDDAVLMARETQPVTVASLRTIGKKHTFSADVDDIHYYDFGVVVTYSDGTTKHLERSDELEAAGISFHLKKGEETAEFYRDGMWNRYPVRLSEGIWEVIPYYYDRYDENYRDDVTPENVQTIPMNITVNSDPGSGSGGTVSDEWKIQNAGTLLPEEMMTVSIEEAYTKKAYTFTPEEEGVYVLQSYAEGDTVGELYQGNSYLDDNDDSGEGTNFLLKAKLKAGVTYTYHIRFWGKETTGSIPVKLSKQICKPVSGMELLSTDQSTPDSPTAKVRITYIDGTEAEQTFYLRDYVCRQTDMFGNEYDHVYETISKTDTQAQCVFYIRYRQEGETSWQAPVEFPYTMEITSSGGGSAGSPTGPVVVTAGTPWNGVLPISTGGGTIRVIVPEAGYYRISVTADNESTDGGEWGWYVENRSGSCAYFAGSAADQFEYWNEIRDLNCTITVEKAKTVKSLEIVKEPESFVNGLESFDAGTMDIRVVYTDGTEETAPCGVTLETGYQIDYTSEELNDSRISYRVSAGGKCVYGILEKKAPSEAEKLIVNGGTISSKEKLTEDYRLYAFALTPAVSGEYRMDGASEADVYNEDLIYLDNVYSGNTIYLKAGETYYLTAYKYPDTEEAFLTFAMAYCIHEFGTWSVLQTGNCQQPRISERTCGSCGEKEQLSEAVPDGHSVVNDPAVAATCTTDGKSAGSHCSRCGKVLTPQKTIAKTGHKAVSDPAVAATCTAAGKTAGTHCSVCHAVITKQNAVAAKGHTFGSYVQTKVPTALEEGAESRTCSTCGAQETRAIAKLTPTISLTATSITLKTKQKTSAVKVSGLAAGDQVASWKSKNTKIAKVTSKGVITAQSKTGTTQIIVTLKSGLKATIRVKVQKKEVACTKLVLDKLSLTLKKGRSAILSYTALPITCIQKPVYSSSNRSVATVSSSGKIKAVKRGKATITVKVGKKKAACKVTVK